MSLPPARVAARGRRAARPSGDDRELAILATAERLLAEKPLSALSVDDLARGAGISRPTFYFYFASKDAVLLTLLDRVVAEADAAFTGGVFDGLQGGTRENWRAALTAYVDTFRAHRSVALAAASARPDNREVRELWARVCEGWVLRATEVIEAARAQGTAPDGLPARQLAIVLNSMNERVVYGTFSGDGPAIPEDQLVDVLLDVWLTTIYRTPHPA
ncbi:TetR family transcriptional regulator [Modestobacter sp. I12A-02628]|uniref:TetR/AcrR family transcriptional regulator n=1 Tax=Goekera deserti TaxID=2497753 RepID=A0A7K3WL01_9ACTN|nr:TetR/AcrR family transcriptional regulator [Goekera deserti]MPQ97049.1 TetR family transcriptional regulator [Goekera deserti]NDI46634.1 TetR family transcriptional regulator [Goekera deserti]NEL56390.1 TetR/AcrR family transcriptional regulator [Goekera deserti]